MFSLKQIIPKFVGTILLSCLAATPGVAELTPPEINSIARNTTVLIAPELTKEMLDDLENNRNNPLASQRNKEGVWNPGSGVIIAKEGKKYYVLTVAHNFKQRHLDENLSYGIRTSDGEVHLVKEVNDRRGCPLRGSLSLGALIRLGCYSISVPNRVVGPDLAVVVFESKENYQVASLGDADAVNIGDRVYISGWPDPEKERNPVTGRCSGRVERRQRRLAWGPVAGKINPSPANNGYSIFYVDRTRPGMSGGPVFDVNGRIVGIHGQGSRAKGEMVAEYCSVSKAPQIFESEDFNIPESAAQRNDPTFLHSRFSSGQNLNFFLGAIERTRINLAFNREAPRGFEGANTALQSGSRIGTIDLFADEDAGGYEDPADVVENVYKAFEFGLPQMFRDLPNGVL